NKTPHCLQALQGSGGRMNSAFFYLAEFELHRRGATENENSHLNTALLIIHFFYNTVEIGEGTVNDANHFTRLEQRLGLGLAAAGRVRGAGCSAVPAMRPRRRALSLARCQVPSFISICTST